MKIIFYLLFDKKNSIFLPISIILIELKISFAHALGIFHSNSVKFYTLCLKAKNEMMMIFDEWNHKIWCPAFRLRLESVYCFCNSFKLSLFVINNGDFDENSIQA